MQKRVVNGEWQTELTKPELRRLKSACEVLENLCVIEPSVQPVHDAVSLLIAGVDEDGVYSTGVA